MSVHVFVHAVEKGKIIEETPTPSNSAVSTKPTILQTAYQELITKGRYFKRILC